MPRKTGLKPGTVLMREHGGNGHHAMVVEGGFAWQGATYPTLSKIARATTGTRWSGPRFYGLREGPDASDAARLDLNVLAERGQGAASQFTIGAGASR